MDKRAFAEKQEPVITGELVREMRGYLESGPDAPDWATHYSIHDDPPLNAGGRQGKSRFRVDIEFERVGTGPRPRLQFEAKRLNSSTNHTVAGYLGVDGLGCFLSGRYPLTHGEAGMLGYVQSETEESWAEQIGARLDAEAEAFGTVPPSLAAKRIATGLDHTWISQHRRGLELDLMLVHHVLLRFAD
ncbi:MAG: hypothetical protein KDD47_03185 [Acidobacteria bacterium]|nr:hypothetical protein [Acidobacteriota bacterium]